MFAVSITAIQKATMIRGEEEPPASPSLHGRTRMIVFPARRSVGLKAVTASLRVEELSQLRFPVGEFGRTGPKSPTR